MRVLILGATGFIGSAVVTELLRNGYAVLALARSTKAENQLLEQGAEVVRGDLRAPTRWSRIVREVDGIVHTAATFTNDMGAVDREVVKEIVAQGELAANTIRCLYTGGVWLYGQTGDTVVSESSPLNPIPGFAWMVENSALLLKSARFSTSVVHPGMVYVRDGGALTRFLPNAGKAAVWGSPGVRWPLVHVDDLATAYRLILERGEGGESYNVAAEQGVRQGDIAAAIARRFKLQSGPEVLSVEQLVARYGDGAVGPTLDQQMSSEKLIGELGWTPCHLDALAELERT